MTKIKLSDDTLDALKAVSDEKSAKEAEAAKAQVTLADAPQHEAPEDFSVEVERAQAKDRKDRMDEAVLEMFDAATAFGDPETLGTISGPGYRLQFIGGVMHSLTAA